MKHFYWVSYQFQLPDGRSGFGATDLVLTGGPMTVDSMDGVKSFLANQVGPGASVVILAISKFES